MSCGDPHETECAEVLDHLYEYLDNEMSDDERAKFREHFDECHPCLEMYGLEQAVKKLVKRCCGSDQVPQDLRSKVMGRIDAIRSGQTAGAGSSGDEEDPACQPEAAAAQPDRKPAAGQAPA